MLKIFTQTLPSGALYVDQVTHGQLQQYFLSHFKQRRVGDVELNTKELSVKIRTPHWEVGVTTRPIFGALKPNQRRLDVSIREIAIDAAVAPHGLIGQSFDHDGVGVDGNMDAYTGDEFTTHAQAEGAIEGVWTDYMMAEPFATSFRFSRFGKREAQARNLSSLPGRRVYTSDTVTATAS